MINLADAVSDIVLPAVRAVFHEREVSAIYVWFDPDRDGGSVVMTPTAVGEDFHDVVVPGDVETYSIDDWRERLRSLPRRGCRRTTEGTP